MGFGLGAQWMPNPESAVPAGPPPLMSLSSVKTLTSSSPGTQPPEDPSKDPPTSPQA